MINLDKLTFIVSNDRAKINKKYYAETKSKDGSISYFLDKDVIKNCIGINKITANDFNTLISVSGKLLADKHYLGFINKDNYEKLFNRLNLSEVINIDNIPSKDMKVLACDVTKDIFVENVDKSLFGISKYLNVVSDKYFIQRHKDLSLFIQPYAKSRKDILCLYRKYDELIKHDFTDYLNIIGYDYLDQCKNIIRIERRLSSFKDIRNAFSINHIGDIYLNELLESNANSITDKFKELTLTEEYLR